MCMLKQAQMLIKIWGPSRNDDLMEDKYFWHHQPMCDFISHHLATIHLDNTRQPSTQFLYETINMCKLLKFT